MSSPRCSSLTSSRMTETRMAASRRKADPTITQLIRGECRFNDVVCCLSAVGCDCICHHLSGQPGRRYTLQLAPSKSDSGLCGCSEPRSPRHSSGSDSPYFAAFRGDANALDRLLLEGFDVDRLDEVSARAQVQVSAHAAQPCAPDHTEQGGLPSTAHRTSTPLDRVVADILCFCSPAVRTFVHACTRISGRLCTRECPVVICVMMTSDGMP